MTRTIRALAVAAVLVVGVVAIPTAVSAQEAGAEISHDAEECIKVLEEGGEPADCHEAPNPILPATNEIIWGAISFVILFVALSKFAYPAIKKGMDGRAERIQADLDAADAAKAEAGQVLDEYRRQLADAKTEAGRIIEEARQAADAMRQDIVARAEAEAGERRQHASTELDDMLARTRADLQARVAELSIELAEKVVEKSLDRETNLALIESYINQLENQGT